MKIDKKGLLFITLISVLFLGGCIDLTKSQCNITKEGDYSKYNITNTNNFITSYEGICKIDFKDIKGFNGNNTYLLECGNILWSSTTIIKNINKNIDEVILSSENKCHVTKL